ncbi:MAG: hypothetical protein IKX36_03680 [Prevotella sp.]|nr:hypothetical protein [Prevotella sp.]
MANLKIKSKAGAARQPPTLIVLPQGGRLTLCSYVMTHRHIHSTRGSYTATYPE